MAVNKVEINGEVKLDLTQDTVTAAQLAQGVTAHDASGELIAGTMTAPQLQIAVTTGVDATVTATKGSKTVSGTADASGNCTLTVNETGTWTVTAVKGVIVNTVDVVVGTNGVTLALINPVFSDNSWEQIIEICQKKTVPDAWKVGDSKIMTIGGVDYQIDIIGKDHDGYSDLSGRAPLTFQFHNCTRSTQMYTSSYQSGWRSSKIRVEDVPAFLGSMPDVVKNAIRSVTKPVDGSSTDDTLFILSEREVFGVTSKCYGDTSKQYEYYTTPANRKKYYSGSTTSDSWWLRSTANTPSYSMGTVTSTGAVGAASCLGFVGVTYAFCF